MRVLFSFMCVLALGLMGCNEAEGTGGSGGEGGEGGVGGSEVACVDNVCPCSESGIRAAIAEGGGPFTFGCDGPTTIVTQAEIIIEKDVILDGEGNLTVDGDIDHRVFSVPGGVSTLRRMTVSGGNDGGIDNAGTLGLANVTVTGNGGISWGPWPGGIHNTGVLTITDGLISENCGNAGSAIWNDGGTVVLRDSTIFGNECGFAIGSSGTVEIVNSTVREDESEAIEGTGVLTITNSTVSGNGVGDIPGGNPTSGVIDWGGTLRLFFSTVTDNSGQPDGVALSGGSSAEIEATIIVGRCDAAEPLALDSNGYNIESPGDTCGFDQPTDQVSVGADDLNLGPLRDNGGPTMTHALGDGSVAIDVIPGAECVDAEGAPLMTDQRGFPRDATCDVGAFEVQP